MTRAKVIRFMATGDISLFLRSAKSDARLGKMLARGDVPTRAFDQLYAEAEEHDPWSSASPRYVYQRNKYEALLELLPPGRRFRNALDVGCGTGQLSRRLATCSAEVLGIDLSEVAINEACKRTSGQQSVSYHQGDVLALPTHYGQRFDLVVVADVIYYLPETSLSVSGLASLAYQLSRLLTPDGLLLVANHYFWGLDADSRLSRRIGRAFRQSTYLKHRQSWRRPFWLASLFETPGASA